MNPITSRIAGAWNGPTTALRLLSDAAAPASASVTDGFQRAPLSTTSKPATATPAPGAAKSVPTFDSFESFWPYYMAQHRHPATRAMHFIGTTAALASGAAGLVTGNPLFFAAMPLLGYGFAWTSHFEIEHNKPATFGHPLYSLRADIKMYGEMARGRLWSGDPGPWTPPAPPPSPSTP